MAWAAASTLSLREELGPYLPHLGDHLHCPEFLPIGPPSPSLGLPESY